MRQQQQFPTYLSRYLYNHACIHLSAIYLHTNLCVLLYSIYHINNYSRQYIMLIFLKLSVGF
ncbi:hypothetical protein BDB00DRAFT_494766 [Zychaea mexicana]|uniref:uncharacterized protein n=1 Tax=Zychaea mexicana TaxID=64656 RepID=UPI0022FDD77F|nr:uncharacterized protein BDB00DRAFT_494766 [Zychaea mexicana]KAI9491385.1 hypothetical protein BDB00DRAFT_494766 [Zychaea mexicana]